MNKVIEMIRRLIVVCLWIFGGCYGIVCIGLGGYAFLALIGLVVNKDFPEWWWVFVFPLTGLVIFAITYVVHKIINWIFQKGESKGTSSIE